MRDGKTQCSPFLMLKEPSTSTTPTARSLSIADGRLLISKQFANALGRPSDAGSIIGKISVGAAMQPVEITQVVNGQPKSVVVPPVERTYRSGSAYPGGPARISSLGTCRGPGTIRDSAGSQVGLAVATDFLQQRRPAGQFFHELPSTDHPLRSAKSLSDERWRR